ncbi:hypothetical protein AB4Z02_18950, partial [Pedococcus sp. 2YAF34]
MPHTPKGPAGDQPDENEEPIIRDKRRIDPETGKVRHPEGGSEGDSSGPDLAHEELVDVGPSDTDSDGAAAFDAFLTDEDLDVLSGQSTADQLAAERLADLQRVTAEYANYRKRTEANREIERERAVGET